jgi:membrane-bound lytic murein transglycosylase D
MQYRNVLSLARRLAAIGLGVAALTLVHPALADESPENPPFLSMSTTLLALAEPGANQTDDALIVHEISGAPQLPGTIDLTVQSTNLWERIRNGFAMTNLNDDLVLHYQQWYQNRPDALRRMVERSRPYLHHIVEELEARGLPTELALLPMVESSFNPNAYSPAHAAGLWQFIPATGKRFNLEQNWWHDKRRDIVASTGAALDYLQTIYEMHGDWHLALASYNWGEGAVKRAIVKNEARGLPTDYPNLTMPNETRHYVPKLQALKNIFSSPALIAQLDLPFIPNEPYFATLETSRPIDVKTAARLANMSLEEFQRLNPSHNRPIIGPDTQVVIPADKLDAFRSKLQDSQTPLTRWQAYTVTSTEALDRIAARFDTTAGELARANGLSEKVRLRAGSTLLVPGNGVGLTGLLNTSTPKLFIEQPRSARSCGTVVKSGKRVAKPCGKPKTSTAGNSRGKTTIKAASKAKASKAVKSSRGKRG